MGNSLTWPLPTVPSLSTCYVTFVEVTGRPALLLLINSAPFCLLSVFPGLSALLSVGMDPSNPRTSL